MYFRDLKAQYNYLQQDIDNAISQVLASGDFVGGPFVEELEENLASYIGVKHCITCANGTDALQLALMAWGVGKGDAVFVPDFTFFSTGEVVAAIGAKPVFVDVDKQTFNISCKNLEEMIRNTQAKGKWKPQVIIAVDLFGQAADYSGLRKIAQKYNLYLLEDGAQGFGGAIKGKKSLSFGDISTTSFYPAKPLGCYGDGGAVFTNNDKWNEIIRSYAVHGKGLHKYDNIRIGMNSRLDALQASILKVKLQAFSDYELDKVNEAANYYNTYLCEKVKIPKIEKEFYSSWAQYSILLKDNLERERIQNALKKEGIPNMIYYMKPMHEQTAFKDNDYLDTDYHVTKRLCETILSLPIHPYLTKEDIESVCETIVTSL